MNSPYHKEYIEQISDLNNKDEDFTDSKAYLKNLEQQIKYFQIENEKLNNVNNILQKEKIELNASLESKEITINQQISLLDNLKKKNENNEIRILDLEKINQQLNYLYIELTQKNKTLIENQKLNLLRTNNKNTTDQLIKFSSQLEGLSIIKSRLEHDNKILVNKINQIQLEHENEINMLKKIHSSELEKKNKIITSLQEGLSSINNNNNNNQTNLNNSYSQIMMEEISNLEKKLKKVSEDNISLKNYIQDLQSKINYYEESIKRKDNYMKELQNELRNSEEQLKLNIIENETLNQENQIFIEKITNEKEDLLKQNQELRKSYEKFNVGIQDANYLFIKKMKNFENIFSNINNKLKESQIQIDKLNETNQFLNYENEKLKRLKERYEKREINKRNKLQRNKSVNLNESRNNTLNSSSSRKNNFEHKTVDSIKDYISNSRINTSDNIPNYNINLDDPFISSQQKSLEIFKNILQKFDENLSSNVSFLNQTKE